MSHKVFGKMDFCQFIDITDPCYNRDTWCRINSLEIEPGEYICIAEFTQDSRVRCLVITKDIECYENADADKYIGEIGVDSGTAGFFNQQLNLNRDELDTVFGNLLLTENLFKKVYFSPNEEYGCCGFFSESGYGDGGYPVYAHLNKNGIPDALEIRFA